MPEDTQDNEVYDEYQAAQEEEEILEEEEDIANQLAAEQEIYVAEKQLSALAEEGNSFKHPSYIKYAILGSISVIQDVVDLADLTGIGAVFGFFISVACTILIIAIFYFTHTRFINARNYISKIEELVPGIQANIAHATRLTLRTARQMRYVPGMQGISRKIPRVLVRIRRAARSNPFTKVIVGNLIDLIPFLGLFPWSTISIVLSYLDERKTFNAAREASEEIFS
jgi:hypothetical protein